MPFADYVLRGFLTLPLTGQRPIVPIGVWKVPGTPFCVYSIWASPIYGFNCVPINAPVARFSEKAKIRPQGRWRQVT